MARHVRPKDARSAFLTGWHYGTSTSHCVTLDLQDVHRLAGREAKAFEEGYHLGRKQRTEASLEADLWDFKS